MTGAGEKVKTDKRVYSTIWKLESENKPTTNTVIRKRGEYWPSTLSASLTRQLEEGFLTYDEVTKEYHTRRPTKPIEPQEPLSKQERQALLRYIEAFDDAMLIGNKPAAARAMVLMNQFGGDFFNFNYPYKINEFTLSRGDFLKSMMTYRNLLLKLVMRLETARA